MNVHPKSDHFHSSVGPGSVKLLRVEICKSKKTGWPRKRPQRFWWRAVEPRNGNIVAMSSEMYTNAQDCEDMARKIFAPSTGVVLYPLNGEPETILPNNLMG